MAKKQLFVAVWYSFCSCVPSVPEQRLIECENTKKALAAVSAKMWEGEEDLVCEFDTEWARCQSSKDGSTYLLLSKVVC